MKGFSDAVQEALKPKLRDLVAQQRRAAAGWSWIIAVVWTDSALAMRPSPTFEEFPAHIMRAATFTDRAT